MRKSGPDARFGDDPDERRRFAIAIPAALLLSALLFSVMGLRPPLVPLPPPVVANVRLERLVIVRSTPKPSPTPRFAGPVARRPILRLPRKAAPRPSATSGSQHATALLNSRLTLPKQLSATGPGVRETSNSTSSGSGNSVGSGSGVGNSRDSSSAKSGTEAGGVSASPGSVGADEPCGEVDFISYDAPQFHGSMTYEKIRATVHFPDGRTEAAEFPYPWVYGNEAEDPWSQRNIRNPHFVTRAQLPPPGAKQDLYSDLIRYILDHTRPDGTTVLREC